MILADSKAGRGASQVKSRVDLLNIHERQVLRIRKRVPALRNQTQSTTTTHPCLTSSVDLVSITTYRETN